MNEILEREAQQIWQSQPVDGMEMSVEAIRLRAGKFERKISRRNLRESIAALIVIAFFSYNCIASDNILFRITWGLFIAGTIWVMMVLQLKGRPKTLPVMLGSSSSLEFFRSELERQRDLIKNVWQWYLAPMVPGYVALNLAWAFGLPHHIGWIKMAALDVFFVAVFVGVWRLNQYGARCLQRSIDSLPPKET
jgi:hypothetical protein